MPRIIRHRLATSGLVLLLSLAAAGPVPASIIVEDFASATLTFHGRRPFTTSGLYDPRDDYTSANGVPGTGFAELAPLHVGEAPRGGTAFFLDKLRETFPVADGWMFNAAARDLSDDSLIIRTYDADAPEDAGEGTTCIVDPTCVGAQFHVEYRPGADDPVSIHWIQVVSSNHPVPDPPGGSNHGQGEYKVDIVGPNPGPIGGDLPGDWDPAVGQQNPYYDYLYAADGHHFLDYPARGDEQNDHRWYAELYVAVGGLQPGVVTIYNGIQWGWRNEFVADEPMPTAEPGGLALAGLWVVLLAGAGRGAGRLGRSTSGA